MNRLVLSLPIAAAALTFTACDTPYFAAFPERAAKNRVDVPGDPRGGRPAAYNDAYRAAMLDEIPPSPASVDRGGSDVPTYATTPSYSPDKKYTLEEITESKPSRPNSPANAPSATAAGTPGAEDTGERILEPQPVYWFGRPNPGNTAAIPVGPIEKP